MDSDGDRGRRKRRLVSYLQIWVGTALAAVTLYLAVRRIDFPQLLVTLRTVRLPLVLLALGASLLATFLKSVRWRHLFHPTPPPMGLERLAGLVAIGQATNLFIPARLGELVRAYLTAEEAGISKAYVLGTIAAEKLLDVVVLAVLVAGLLPFLALPDWLAGRVGPTVIAALAVTAAALALVGGRRLVLRCSDVILRPFPAHLAARWRAHIVAGLDGLAVLSSRPAAAAIWGWTAASWVASWATSFILLPAFDLPPSPLIALFLLVVLQIGVAVPSTPGKVGVFHYLCVLALGVFGVSSVIGFGYGLVLHVLVVGGISAWAALALWRRSWNLRRLAAAALSD